MCFRGHCNGDEGCKEVLIGNGCREDGFVKKNSCYDCGEEVVGYGDEDEGDTNRNEHILNDKDERNDGKEEAPIDLKEVWEMVSDNLKLCDQMQAVCERMKMSCDLLRRLTLDSIKGHES